MNRDRSDNQENQSLLDICLGSWPELRIRLSPKARELVLSEPPFIGSFCTHAVFANRLYVRSQGCTLLLSEAVVPHSFQWIGIQYTGSEYLFAIWRAADRWFWFYDQTMRPFSNRRKALRARQRLHRALERWDSGQRVVAYSGPWGWYDPRTDEFVKDR